jgi:hypothetical protein
MSEEEKLAADVAATSSTVSDWRSKIASLESQAAELNGVVTKAIASREGHALSALLGDARAKAAISSARASQHLAEEELADVINYAIPASKTALAAAEAAAASARGALAKHRAEIEIRRRIGIAAKVDAAIAALAAALKEFDDSGTGITSLDVLPHGMFGSSAISRFEEIVGARRVRSALPKSFIRFYPGALHEEMPAASLEASETRIWNLPPEQPEKKAA